MVVDSLGGQCSSCIFLAMPPGKTVLVSWFMTLRDLVREDFTTINLNNHSGKYYLLLWHLSWGKQQKYAGIFTCTYVISQHSTWLDDIDDLVFALKLSSESIFVYLSPVAFVKQSWVKTNEFMHPQRWFLGRGGRSIQILFLSKSSNSTVWYVVRSYKYL